SGERPKPCSECSSDPTSAPVPTSQNWVSACQERSGPLPEHERSRRPSAENASSFTSYPGRNRKEPIRAVAPGGRSSHSVSVGSMEGFPRERRAGERAPAHGEYIRVAG